LIAAQILIGARELTCTVLLAGLILHLLSFFTLPYHNEADNNLLEQEIRAYKG
jgi:hypothetical protein